ncbi:NifU family protein [Parvularcula sp. ZS-1/3]|uniref:NifU family protein n=1 Tax=Parvularcula mediterranea TaxID=2732508 RepID=A0A7Y3W4H5_9PROT|nr:NifU family protein [Parvularcula mediterranea]NNU15755.1 NifU family protein [Parvularcula mediterranea]
MFIRTEDTPNPNSLKFLPDQPVLGPGELGMDFPTPGAAKISPLAAALFDVDGVVSVYLGADFVTVSKDQTVDWEPLKPALLGTIADFLAAGIPVVDQRASTAAEGVTSVEDYKGEDREVVEQIIELLDTRVRPAVAQDGGDIIFHRFEPGDGIVFLTMQGACAGCPSSTMTLKSGIENLLKHYVPEVQSVEAVA